MSIDQEQPFATSWDELVKAAEASPLTPDETLRVVASDRFIRDGWRTFRPDTRRTLEAMGFADGARINASARPYPSGSIGALVLASEAVPPRNRRDGLPDALADPESTLKICEQMALDSRFRTSDFAALMLRAMMRTALGVINQDMIERGEHPWPSGPFRGLNWIIAFMWTLPFAVGYGLSFAFKGQGLLASLCFAYASIGGLIYLETEKPRSARRVASAAWTDLILSGYLGTGSGLKSRLTEMTSAGIAVPAVMVDLCDLLPTSVQNGQ
jgi:hypothetical protein